MQYYPESTARTITHTRKLKHVLSFLLILLFTYAAMSKLLDFQQFRAAMMNQPFPHWVASILIFFLPPVELLAAALLVSNRTELAGFWLSFVLMVEFTGYISLVLLHFWATVPCSCGGVLGGLSWGPHLVFNLVFLLITISGLYIKILERRAGDKE